MLFGVSYWAWALAAGFYLGTIHGKALAQGDAIIKAYAHAKRMLQKQLDGSVRALREPTDELTEKIFQAAIAEGLDPEKEMKRWT